MVLILAAVLAAAFVVWVVLPLVRPVDERWAEAERARWFGSQAAREERRFLRADAEEDFHTGKLDQRDYDALKSDADAEEGPP